MRVLGSLVLLFSLAACSSSSAASPDAGAPVAGVLVDAGTHVRGGIAVDDQNVYWSDGQTGIFAVPKGGGAVTTLTSRSTEALSLTLDNGVLYFLGDEGVFSMPVGGATTTEIAGLGGEAEPVGGLAISGGQLFWPANSGSSTFGGGQVLSAPADGGAAVALAANQSYPITVTVNGGAVFWENIPLYSTSTGGDSTLLSAPLDGGPATTLATASLLGASFGVDAQNVYYLVGAVSGTDGGVGGISITEPQQLMAVPRTGGAATALTVTINGRAIAFGSFLLADETFYFAQDADIYKVPVAGGEATLLGTAGAFSSFAVDATSIYVGVNSTTNPIWKFPR